MKALYFLDKSNNKIVCVAPGGRLVLTTFPPEKGEVDYILNGWDKERSAAYLHAIKSGKYESIIEPGSYMDNVEVYEVDLTSGLSSQVPAYVEVKTEHVHSASCNHAKPKANKCEKSCGGDCDKPCAKKKAALKTKAPKKAAKKSAK